MQKVLLTSVSAIALSISATAALASSSTTYDSQEGTGQVANIDQSGGNYDQVGALGAPFDQNNGAYAGSNTIAITQTGSYNTFGVSAASFQSGSENVASVTQNGYHSSVELQQIGAGNGPSYPAGTDYSIYWSNDVNGGSIVQDSTASYSDVFLSQNGTGNIFNIGQGGYNNQTTATQVGENMLWVRQGTLSPDVWWSPFAASFDSSSPSESNSTISVYQNAPESFALSNYAALLQGGGNANSITVTQFGSTNNADVIQNGSNNVFSSYQAGSGNYVGAEAGDLPDTGSVPLTQVPITQIGTGNQYYSTQLGVNAIALATQTGYYNYVYNYQSGENNTIIGAQNGNSNQVYSWQTGANDTLNYTQAASNNFISNNQSGSGNTVTIRQ
jgi:hypothetical protein